MRKKATRVACVWLLILAAGLWAQGRFPLPIVDSDGDGLSDEDEICKYLTDPLRRDSDGNGRPDGDWVERRQFTSSFRVVVRVLKPYDSKAMASALPESAHSSNLSPWLSNAASAARLLLADATNDSFQDTRVIAETGKWVDLECVLYPWNRGVEARRAPDPDVKRLLGHLAARLPENEFWRLDKARMEEWLRPRKVCNWDEDLRVRLVRVLKNDRIDPVLLSDTDLVETFIPWLLKNSRCIDKASLIYRFDLRANPADVPAHQLAAFTAEKPDELDKAGYANFISSGKAMAKLRGYEWGLSWCCYAATMLRALGIPTRMAQFVPVHDVEEPASSVRLARAIWHPRLRNWIEQGAHYGRNNHLTEEPFQVLTMLEVWVGNRWRLVHLPRELGGVIFPASPVLYHTTPGPMIRIHTFADPGERDFAATWGQHSVGRGTNAELPMLKPWRILQFSWDIGRTNRMATTWIDWMSAQAPPPPPLTNKAAPLRRPGLPLPSQVAAAMTPNDEQFDVYAGAGCWAWPSMPDEYPLFSLRRPDQPAEFPPIMARGLFMTNLGNLKPPSRTNVTVFQVVNALWFESEDRPKSIPDVIGKPLTNERWLLVEIKCEGLDDELVQNFLRWGGRDLRLKSDSGAPIRLETTYLFWKDHLVLRVPPYEGKNLRPGVPYKLVVGSQMPEWRWAVADGLFLEVPAEGDAP